MPALNDMAQIFEVRVPRLLKKELIDLLSEVLPLNLDKALLYLSQEEYEIFKDVAKGEEIEADKVESSLLLEMFLDVYKGKVIMIKEFNEAFLKLSAYQKRKIAKGVKDNTEFLEFTCGLANIYGVLSLNEYTYFLERYYGTMHNYVEAIKRVLAIEREETFATLDFENEMYLISYLLTFEMNKEAVEDILDGHDEYQRVYLPLEKIKAYHRLDHVEDENLFKEFEGLLVKAKIDEEVIGDILFTISHLLRLGLIPPNFVHIALEDADEIPKDQKLYEKIIQKSLELYEKTRFFVLNGAMMVDLNKDQLN